MRFVTVYSHNRIDRYDPATRTTTTFADAAGVLWTTAGTVRKGRDIWRVERSGVVQRCCELPDAIFMNGCTMHPNG